MYPHRSCEVLVQLTVCSDVATHSPPALPSLGLVCSHYLELQPACGKDRSEETLCVAKTEGNTVEPR